MKLAIRIIDERIYVCEKGSGRIIDIIGSTNIPCDGLIKGYYELPVCPSDTQKRLYAKYRLDAEIRKAEKQIQNGISPEIALFAFKRLFISERVAV